MAKSKSSSFWLTENVQIAATAVVGTADLSLGAYIDVGDQQALAIEQVDIIWQDEDGNGLFDSLIGSAVIGNAAFDFQLTDLNPGGVILRADDNSLIASGSINLDDTNNVISRGPDLFPDTFGKLDEARLVINDQLYMVVTSTAAVVAAHTLHASVRIKARIVKLGVQDWMALSITGMASDN